MPKGKLRVALFHGAPPLKYAAASPPRTPNVPTTADIPNSTTPTASARKQDASASCVVRDTPMGAALFATCRIPLGSCVLLIEGRVQSHPTRYSIQLDVDRHIEADGALPDAEMRRRHPWRFLNHSCEPNARVHGQTLVATRPIADGEQITFDYTTTEARMAEPFDCVCGAEACIGTVRGYDHLSDEAKKARADRLAPHLRANSDGAA